MACDQNPDHLSAYLDGELTGGEASRVEEHVRSCTACAVAVAERMHLHRGLAAARNRYQPDLAWKQRMLAQISPRPAQKPRWFQWVPVPIAAATAIVLLIGLWTQQHSLRNETFREVADLHISDLASDHPVDVVSTDRHTVKPWFAGRIPFSFNVPELAGTGFTLIGGRVAYLQQEPGAQLLAGMGQHRISILVFRESADLGRALPSESGVHGQASFSVDTWQASGLRFVVIGDADTAAIGKLASLFRQANP